MRTIAAITTAVMLLGSAGPLVQHVCAEMGLNVAVISCPHAEEEDASEAPSESERPCHEEESDHDGFAGDGTTMACCDGAFTQFAAPDALLTDRPLDALVPVIAASVVSALNISSPVDAATQATPTDRAPPAPDTPLFILHASFLN